MRAGADKGTVQLDSGREPRVTLIEPDVALTDFGLAAECALFAGWLFRRGLTGNPLRRWFVVLFVALGLGALLGGITHGFLPDAGSDVARAVWAATLMAIGLAAFASWAVGAHVLFAEQHGAMGADSSRADADAQCRRGAVREPVVPGCDRRSMRRP